MATISLIQQFGDKLHISYSDGMTVIAPALQDKIWVAPNKDETSGGGGNSGPGSGSGATAGVVTAEMVSVAVTSVGGSVGAMLVTPTEIAAAFNSAITELEPGLFGSKARLACLVGECAQETDWFQTFEEYAKTGSYAPYWGRGFIQLTWQSNYSAFTRYLNGKGKNVDFTTNYTEVKNLPWAAYTAIYYFTQTYRENISLLEWCDRCDNGSGNWNNVSGIINAGDPYYVGASYGIRNTAINAVYAVTTDPASGVGYTLPMRNALGRITSGYRTADRPTHAGTDMASPTDGEPIYAFASGTVVAAGAATGFGQWIVIDHSFDGQLYSTVYGHMWPSGVLVSTGTQVASGQHIAAQGNNGESTGSHLHFEVWQGGRLSGGFDVDPMPWLRLGTER